MKILVISLAGIGNTLMAAPMIKLLRKKYLNSHITVLVMFKGSREILEENPYLNEVILWDFINKPIFQSLAFLLNLRKQKIDISILSYPANRIEYNLINFIIGAKIRIAHKYNKFTTKNLGFLNNKTIPEDDEKHDIEENIRLVSLANLSTEIKEDESLLTEDGQPLWGKPKIYLTDKDKKFADNWLRERNLKYKTLIGIHAGTAPFKNQIQRRWDKEKFGELGKELAEKYNATILLFGSNAEKDLKEDIQKMIGENAFLVNGTTMRETSALIEKCSLFISSDSALMHIAASLNVQCVSIFGPTNPKWVYPYKTKYIIVRKELPCSPCFYYSQKPLSCKFKDFRCIKSITVEEVLTASDKLIL
ncbi:MAG: glycosyltransferase family 9 protein [bacterium]|nr:glycosyltransferase family 9 protein [bacterium]